MLGSADCDSFKADEGDRDELSDPGAESVVQVVCVALSVYYLALLALRPGG